MNLVSTFVQWLIRFDAGSDGSIRRTVPTLFSMHAVYTPLLSGIAAYAIPAAAANSTPTQTIRFAERLTKAFIDSLHFAPGAPR